MALCASIDGMSKKILIVEDERDVVKLLRYNLEKEGFRVTAVTDGSLALAEMRREDADLVILDLMLPGMDGLMVCQALRQEASTAAVPVIMLTARGEESDRVRGLELGADDYIVKPFSPRELVSRVEAVLARMRT